MKITEKKIFEIEKELINKYFRGLQPREIELVEDDSFIGAAREKLLINRNYLKKCTKAELANLLKHELIHYALPGRGHDKDFLDKAEEVGTTIGGYEVNRYIDELQPLGFLEEVLGEDEKTAEYVYHKKPQWNLFEDTGGSCTYIGGRLYLLRTYTHLSQKDVAREAGISVELLKTIEETEGWVEVEYDLKTEELLHDDYGVIERIFKVIASKYEEET
jgi:hypothetical protein